MVDSQLNALRDLPGVARVTELTRNPRLFEYPASSTTMNEIRGIVVSLFGVCDFHLAWEDEPDDDPEEKAAWENHFKVTELPWSQSAPFWEAIGWDISDGSGGELISAHWFMRAIIAAEGCLDPDARFTPDGSGTWPLWDDDDGEHDQRLAETLEAEVNAFLRRRV